MNAAAATWAPYDATAKLPQGPFRRGSKEHLTVMCRALLDTHDPYKPAILDNGVRIMVPPHIGAGTRIVVDVYEQAYVGKAG